MFRKEAGSLVPYEVMPWIPEMETSSLRRSYTSSRSQISRASADTSKQQESTSREARMTEIEATYEEIERLIPASPARQLLMRALAVASTGRELRCEMPTCYQESRYVFVASREEDYRNGGRKFIHPAQLSVDHRVPVAKGGTHRPDNLRFAHWGCNHRAGARATA